MGGGGEWGCDHMYTHTQIKRVDEGGEGRGRTGVLDGDAEGDREPRGCQCLSLSLFWDGLGKVASRSLSFGRFPFWEALATCPAARPLPPLSKDR